MTPGAENAGIGENRLHCPGIFSVPRQRTVASLAIDARMFAGLFDVENIGVAGFASLMPRVHNGQRRNLRQRIRSVMTIFPEALGNKLNSEAEEDRHPNQEHADDPQKVLCILESIHTGDDQSIYGSIDRC